MPARLKQQLLTLGGRVAPIEILQQLRWEINLRIRAALGACAPRQRSLLRRLSESSPADLRVNLGCGPLATPGWLNVDGAAPAADLIQILGKPLALPDAC